MAVPVTPPGSTEDRRALTWSTMAWTAAGLAIGFVTFLE